MMLPYACERNPNLQSSFGDRRRRGGDGHPGNVRASPRRRVWPRRHRASQAAQERQQKAGPRGPAIYGTQLKTRDEALGIELAQSPGCWRSTRSDLAGVAQGHNRSARQSRRPPPSCSSSKPPSSRPANAGELRRIRTLQQVVQERDRRPRPVQAERRPGPPTDPQAAKGGRFPVGKAGCVPRLAARFSRVPPSAG